MFDLNSDSDPKALKEAEGYIKDTLPSVLKLVPGGKAGMLKSFGDREKAVEGAWVVTECGKSV